MNPSQSGCGRKRCSINWRRRPDTEDIEKLAEIHHYVWSTFPIVERQEVTAYGRYRSRDLCLAYMNALAAGRPDATPDA